MMEKENQPPIAMDDSMKYRHHALEAQIWELLEKIQLSHSTTDVILDGNKRV